MNGSNRAKIGTKTFLLSLTAALALAACGGGGSTSSTSSSGTSLSGSASAYPFLIGSTVTCAQVGGSSSVSTTVTSNAGAYSCSGISWTGVTRVSVAGAISTTSGGTESGSTKLITTKGSGNDSGKNPNFFTSAAAELVANSYTDSELAALASTALTAAVRSSDESAYLSLTGTPLVSGVDLETVDPYSDATVTGATAAVAANMFGFSVMAHEYARANGYTFATMVTSIVNGLTGTDTTSTSTNYITGIKATSLATAIGNAKNSLGDAVSVTGNASATSVVGNATGLLTLDQYVAKVGSSVTFNPSLEYTTRFRSITSSGGAVTLTVGQMGASSGATVNLAATDTLSGSFQWAYYGSATTTGSTKSVTVAGGASTAGGVVELVYTPAAASSKTAGVITITATAAADSSKTATITIPYTALSGNEPPRIKAGSFNTADAITWDLSAVVTDASTDFPATYYISSMWTHIGGYTPLMNWATGWSSTISSWSAVSGATPTNTAVTTTGAYAGLAASASAKTTPTGGLTFTGSNIVTVGDLGSLILNSTTGALTYTRSAYGTTGGIAFTGTFGFGYAVIDKRGYGSYEKVSVGVSQNHTNTSTSAP